MIPPGRSLEARVDAIADAMGERVAERLIAVFRELPNTPIYSPHKGVFAPLTRSMASSDHPRVQLCLGQKFLFSVKTRNHTTHLLKRELVKFPFR